MKKIILLLLISVCSFSQNGNNHNFNGITGCVGEFLTSYTLPNGNSLATSYFAKQRQMDSLDIKRTVDDWHSNNCSVLRYKKKDYAKTGYDLGHFTPFHMLSFSYAATQESYWFQNQAPQLSYCNEHPWEQSEMKIIEQVKAIGNMSQITGVIYSRNPITLGKYLQVPDYYFKVCYFVGIGMVGIIQDNKTCKIIQATADQIEQTFNDHMGIKVDLFSDLSQTLQTKYESKNLPIDIINSHDK